jgi:hypothetical protein
VKSGAGRATWLPMTEMDWAVAAGAPRVTAMALRDYGRVFVQSRAAQP